MFIICLLIVLCKDHVYHAHKPTNTRTLCAHLAASMRHSTYYVIEVVGSNPAHHGTCGRRKHGKKLPKSLCAAVPQKKDRRPRTEILGRSSGHSNATAQKRKKEKEKSRHASPRTGRVPLTPRSLMLSVTLTLKRLIKGWLIFRPRIARVGTPYLFSHPHLNVFFGATVFSPFVLDRSAAPQHPPTLSTSRSFWRQLLPI